LRQLRIALVEFVDREGWRALGFDSPRAWKEARYPDLALSTFYHRLEVGRRDLSTAIPTVGNYGTPAPAPNPVKRPGRIMGSKDKDTRYQARDYQPAPEPMQGPLALPPTDVPDASTVACSHCGGTGRVPRPSKLAPSRSMAYYCATCGRELRYFSPRCPHCRQLGTVQAR
jgi:hypothetical protein